MFKVMWSDGFYITRNGASFIEGFARDVDVSQIETLCDMLNAAQQSFAPDAPPETCEHGNLPSKCPVEICSYSKHGGRR